MYYSWSGAAVQLGSFKQVSHFECKFSIHLFKRRLHVRGATCGFHWHWIEIQFCVRFRCTYMLNNNNICWAPSDGELALYVWVHRSGTFAPWIRSWEIDKREFSVFSFTLSSGALGAQNTQNAVHFIRLPQNDGMNEWILIVHLRPNQSTRLSFLI